MMQIMRSSDHNDHEEFSLWLSEVYHQNVPWKEWRKGCCCDLTDIQAWAASG